MLCSSSNSASANAFASSVLPTPVGPRNKTILSDGGVLNAGAGAQYGVAYAAYRLVLTHYALVQYLVKAQQLIPLSLHKTGNRMPVHRATMRAISSPRPQCFAKSVFSSAAAPPRRRPAPLQLGQPAVFKLRRPVEVVLVFPPFSMAAFTCSISRRSCCTFSISCFSFASFACMPRKVSRSSELLCDLAEMLGGYFIRLLLKSRLLYLQLHDFAPYVVHLGRHGIHFGFLSWRRPRPQGQWPYRAGNGRLYTYWKG